MMAGPYYKILKVHLWGPAKGFKLNHHLPLTLEAPSDLWHDVAQITEQFALQPRTVADPSFVLSLTQK